MAKPWTLDEINYLQDSWGTKPLQTMSKHLNRTIISIERKANRLHLGSWLDSGDYITLNQLWKALGLGNGNGYRKISWMKNRNFPVKYKKSKKRNTQIVYIKDFWRWAEYNQDMLDLSKLEPLSLGPEPDWVDSKRLEDKIKNINITEDNWTRYEDNKLLDMLKSYRYTTKQIANTLYRTEQAVIQRIHILDVKYRPLPENKTVKWTEEEVNILKQNICSITNYIELCKLLPNRSEKAIKSKVYLIYGTQDLHRISNSITK